MTFARGLGVDVHALGRAEYGLVPLRYDFVRVIAKKFGLNIGWLAEGTGPMRPSHDLDPSLEEKIPPGCLFSVAFERHLKKYLAPRSKFMEAAEEAGLIAKFITPLGLPCDGEKEWAGTNLVADMMKKLPASLQLPYVLAVADATRKFERKHEREIKAHQSAKQKGDT